jgi:hypothetical protein
MKATMNARRCPFTSEFNIKQGFPTVWGKGEKKTG